MVTLKDKVTGKKIVKASDENWLDDGTFYNWFEGNFSCDCNRSRFLYQDDDKVLPCNNGDNRIVIELIKDLNGEIIWSCDDK